MYTIKRKLFRVFFLIEIVVFGYYYVYGTQGLMATYVLMDEMHHVQSTIDGIAANIQELEASVYAWKHEPFLKEQWAREKLQLAHPHDIIYFVMQ